MLAKKSVTLFLIIFTWLWLNWTCTPFAVRYPIDSKFLSTPGTYKTSLMVAFPIVAFPFPLIRSCCPFATDIVPVQVSKSSNRLLSPVILSDAPESSIHFTDVSDSVLWAIRANPFLFEFRLESVLFADLCLGPWSSLPPPFAQQSFFQCPDFPQLLHLVFCLRWSPSSCCVVRWFCNASFFWFLPFLVSISIWVSNSVSMWSFSLA